MGNIENNFPSYEYRLFAIHSNNWDKFDVIFKNW